MHQWWIQPDIHGGVQGERSEPGSVPIELRRGFGGAAPGKFLGDYTLKSAFLQ